MTARGCEPTISSSDEKEKGKNMEIREASKRGHGCVMYCRLDGLQFIQKVLINKTNPNGEPLSCIVLQNVPARDAAVVAVALGLPLERGWIPVDQENLSILFGVNAEPKGGEQQ